MTDLTNQTEKVFKCPAKGCASMVPASGQAEHKKGHSDRAALDNQVRQFLTRFGGDYLAEQFHRIDLELRGDGTDAHPGVIPDVDDLLTRVDKLENAPTATPTGTGVQVDTWDDPDLTNDDPDTGNVTTLPRINPLTGLPE